VNDKDPDIDAHLKSSIDQMVSESKAGHGNSLMNAPISDLEVQCTFGKGSNTPGPDGISAQLVDKPDRDYMHRCLELLWNRAWADGHFIRDWKMENRVVIPKAGKDDYNECSSYRTISITSCLGKRSEYISSQRLITFLESVNFDHYQFAYIKEYYTSLITSSGNNQEEHNYWKSCWCCFL